MENAGAQWLTNGHCCGEGLLEKGAAETQTFGVDAVANTLRHVPFDGEAHLGELLAGNEHGIDRDDLVHVAMHEQDRRS